MISLLLVEDHAVFAEALVDVSLPRMNGIELVTELCQKYPQMACLMISGHVSGNYVRRSLEAGARGYVVKDSVSGIVDAIHRVLGGEIYVSKEIRNFNRL